jgi:competence protein ComEC
VLFIYAIFVGGSPSVIRAAIMAVIAFGGQLIGRKNTGLNALGLTAGVMCLLQPQLPWDVSFQLSFAATLGLVLFADPLQKWLINLLSEHYSEKTAARVANPISEYFLFTLAAQITTLPVIMLQFKQFSLISLLANPLVLPVQPVVMIGGMAVTMLGMMWLPLGRITAILVWPFVAYSNWMVSLLSRIRGGSMTLSIETAVAFSLLLLLMLMIFILRKEIAHFVKNIRWVYLAGILLMAVIVLGTILWRSPDGILHIQLTRTAKETTTFIKSPSGTSLLIDPSSESNLQSAFISSQASPWYFHLDDVLVTDLKSQNDL